MNRGKVTNVKQLRERAKDAASLVLEVRRGSTILLVPLRCNGSTRNRQEGRAWRTCAQDLRARRYRLRRHGARRAALRRRPFVRVPTRVLANGNHLLVLPTVEVVAANIHDLRVLGQLFEGMDVVINLVGILNEHGAATFASAHSDLATQGGRGDARARVKRLLHMSSLGAGARRRATTCAARPTRKPRANAPRLLDTTIFRPSVIFGPRDSLTNRFAGLLRHEPRRPAARAPEARASRRSMSATSSKRSCARFERSHHRGQTYELCGPDVMTLEQLVRLTAALPAFPATSCRCRISSRACRRIVMDFFPGKPFSTDNYKSLTIDSVCRRTAARALGLRPLDGSRDSRISRQPLNAQSAQTCIGRTDFRVRSRFAFGRDARHSSACRSARGFAPARALPRRTSADRRPAREQALESRHAVEVGGDRREVRVVQPFCAQSR